MGSAAAARLGMDYADFLAFEEAAEVRHEFLDGEVFAMAGGSLMHGLLAANFIARVSSRLIGRGCFSYTADVRIRVPTTGLSTYPDVSVICGPPARAADDHQAATNPTLLVEVLSKSTERWDRGEKFAHYQQLASLRHYVLISQHRVRVEHLARNDDGSWTLRDLGPGDVLRVADLDVEVPVDDLYAGWSPPEDAAARAE